MKISAQDERRNQPRFPQHLKVHITELPLLGAQTGKRGATVTGHTYNISQGGLCVITRRALVNSSVVRCEIPLGSDPVLISTLTQVRWSRPENVRTDRFLSGLEFLI